MGRIITTGARTLVLVLLAASVSHCQITCPEGMYRAWAGNWCCTSKCGPGTSIVHSCTKDNKENTECEPCGSNYFNPYADQFDCTSKDLCDDPNQEMKFQGNATTDNVCQCRIGYYRVSTLCLHGPECPPGKGATRSGHCEVCLHGTFSNITSHIQPCLHWQRCPIGYIEGRPGTNISDVVCTSHPLDWLFNTNPPDVIIVNTIKNQTHQKNEKEGMPSSTVVPMAVGICAALVVVVGIVWLIRRHREKEKNKPSRDEESTATAEDDGLLQPAMTDFSGQSTVMEETLQFKSRVNANGNGMATFTKLPVADDPEPSDTDTAPKLTFMALLPDPKTIPVNESTIDYIEQHLGDDYLDFARGLPVTEGCELTKTDLDSLKHTYKYHGPREAIRETVSLWKRKQGDGATLEGLLQGLAACGREDMVRKLCELNHVH